MGYDSTMTALPVTVAETQAFIAAAKDCLAEEERFDAITMIANSPDLHADRIRQKRANRSAPCRIEPAGQSGENAGQDIRSVNAMKKKSAFEKIMGGLNDAIAFAEGDRTRGVILKVEVQNVDIAALRRRLGLSQSRFAAIFGFSPKTIRNWEQGIRHPEGPARVLIRVIEREPEAVLRALR
jgi:putative transcriptional regulator